MRTKHTPWLIAVMAIACVIPMGSAHAADGKYTPPPSPIETAKVVTHQGSGTITLYGNVHADRSATVAAELSGNIVSFKKEPGDRVKKGETVCRIESGNYQLELEARKSRLASAKASAEKARLEMERATTLYEKGIGSQEVYDSKRLAYQMAEAELSAAKTAHSQGERDLSLTNVRAPYSGVIAKKLLDIGDWASPGKPLFEILDLSRVYVSAELPEQELSRVTKGKGVKVMLDAYPARSFDGTVSRISPRANMKSRGVTARIDINNAEGLALDGLFARVEVPLSGRESILVSKDGLVTRGPNKMLFKVVGKTVKQVPVTVLGQTGDMLEVSGDIKPGDEIAVTGNEILRDGAEVNVTLRR